MAHIIVLFPPAAGGNHLKNLIDQDSDKSHILKIYEKQHSPSVHSKVGRNFQPEDLVKGKITHGHFGEIMSHQDLVMSLNDKIKLVILSPDTYNDRKILFQRRCQIMGHSITQLGDYFDGEQVFLYEPFMYHHYFKISMNNIMAISISDWFKPDISHELERLSYFLQMELDKSFCLHLHSLWYNKNFL